MKAKESVRSILVTVVVALSAYIAFYGTCGLSSITVLKIDELLGDAGNGALGLVFLFQLFVTLPLSLYCGWFLGNKMEKWLKKPKE